MYSNSGLLLSGVRCIFSSTFTCDVDSGAHHKTRVHSSSKLNDKNHRFSLQSILY